MKESTLIADCKQWLEYHGCVIVQTHSGYRKPAECGIPDLMGATADGLCIVVECKGEKGKLSSKQEAMVWRFREKNAIVLLPKSIEELEAQYAQSFAGWDEK